MPSYSPPFAPHVRGTYPERTYDAERELVPARVTMLCAGCAEHGEALCATGRYRERIAKWSLTHVGCAAGRGGGRSAHE